MDVGLQVDINPGTVIARLAFMPETQLNHRKFNYAQVTMCFYNYENFFYMIKVANIKKNLYKIKLFFVSYELHKRITKYC